MTIFTNTKKQEKQRLEEQTMRENNARLKKIQDTAKREKETFLAFMQEKNTEDFVEAFIEAETLAKKLLIPTARVYDNNPNPVLILKIVLSYIESIKNSFFKIDRRNLSDANIIIISNFFLYVLPRCMKNFPEANVAYSTQDRVCQDLKKSNKDFADMLHNQQKEIIEKKYSIDKTKEYFNFSSFVVSDEEINSLVLKIGALWKETISNDLSPEESYFLERITSSYIPEALALYKRLQLGSETIQKKSKHVVIEQLTVIQERMSEILEAKLETLIQTLTTQTEIIKSMADEDFPRQKAVK